VTSEKPYAVIVGNQYSVVADDLYAYGVYESLDDKATINYIILVPHGTISGPEVAFRQSISKGQVITVLSAWRRFIPMQNGVYYLVEVVNSPLPEGIPVRLELFRGNEGAGADLNPAVYRKLASRE